MSADGDRELLDAALLDAHRAGDARSLAHLYAEAAASAESAEAAAFYRTQAYVFALDCGDKIAAKLHRALLAEGREDP